MRSGPAPLGKPARPRRARTARPSPGTPPCPSTSPAPRPIRSRGSGGAKAAKGGHGLGVPSAPPPVLPRHVTGDAAPRRGRCPAGRGRYRRRDGRRRGPAGRECWLSRSAGPSRGALCALRGGLAVRPGQPRLPAPLQGAGVAGGGGRAAAALCPRCPLTSGSQAILVLGTRHAGARGGNTGPSPRSGGVRGCATLTVKSIAARPLRGQRGARPAYMALGEKCRESKAWEEKRIVGVSQHWAASLPCPGAEGGEAPRAVFLSLSCMCWLWLAVPSLILRYCRDRDCKCCLIYSADKWSWQITDLVPKEFCLYCVHVQPLFKY